MFQFNIVMRKEKLKKQYLASKVIVEIEIHEMATKQSKENQLSNKHYIYIKQTEKNSNVEIVKMCKYAHHLQKGSIAIIEISSISQPYTVVTSKHLGEAGKW